MEDSRKYSVYPSNLNIAASFKCYKEFLESRGYKGGKITNLEHMFKLEVSPYRTLLPEDFEELIQLLDKYPHSLPIELHTKWEKGSNLFFANYIYLSKSSLEISVKSNDLDIISSVHDNLQQCFQASNPHQDQIERLSKYGLKKSIFLAHGFDEHGNKLAAILNRFLVRLGFDVKEGEGYETKDIPEKVASKIDCQDIFICLVTSGDTSWILSEASYAKGKNKYLIIICQDNVPFNKGIIGGDYEHLPFPESLIEKCFSDLVYALPI
jgi:5S rRNA maturation endonuclease (ribonuclease M5)